MTYSSIILLVIIICVNFVFFRWVYRLYQLVNLGQGNLSVSNCSIRIKDILLKGFCQVFILRETSGIFHFFIFWGFIALAFGSLENIVSSLIPGFSLDFLGQFDFFVNSSQDVLATLVCVSLIVSIYRRLITKPKRLEAPSPWHKVDAFLIICLIFIIIATFFMIRIVGNNPGFTPFADILRATIFDNILENKTYYNLFSWIHNLTVLGFIAYLPYSKHIHILTSLPNLFFKDQFKNKGTIERIDFEDEESENFGIEKITDYSKKDLLELVACTECGYCQQACPAYNTDKPLSPKNVILDLKKHLFKMSYALLKNPDTTNQKEVFSKVISQNVLWACTTCRACEAVCPVEIMPMSKLIGIRQNSVLMDGNFPSEAITTLKNIENQYNPWGFPQEERAKWAETLEVKTLAEDMDVEYLFFVGCAGSYDQRCINVSKSIVNILKKANIKFGILGTEEKCTGDNAKRIGNEFLAQKLILQNIEVFNRYKVKKIITGCPHCYNTIKNEYPQYGGSYSIVHHTVFIHELLRSSKLKINHKDRQMTKVVFHDPCYLGRYNDVYDIPREILKTYIDVTVTEMERNREKSFCCGGGGGRMWMEDNIGRKINIERSNEALKAKAGTVATACPFCLYMLTDGIKESSEMEDVDVKDIAEIVASCV